VGHVTRMEDENYTTTLWLENLQFPILHGMTAIVRSHISTYSYEIVNWILLARYGSL
jgi:hypothetical protein